MYFLLFISATTCYETSKQLYIIIQYLCTYIIIIFPFLFFQTGLIPQPTSTILPIDKPNTNISKLGVQQQQQKPNYKSPLTRSRSFISQEPSTKILTKSPPSITVGLRPQLEVFESSNPLEFKVIYLGEPMPNVTWKKNDVPITEGTSEKIKHKNNW